MKKRKSSELTRLWNIKCPTSSQRWPVDIIRSKYMDSIIHEDMVDELKWMHIRSPIDHIADSLFNRIIISPHSYYFSPPPRKILIYLGTNFQITYLYHNQYLDWVIHSYNRKNSIQLIESMYLTTIRTIESCNPEGHTINNYMRWGEHGSIDLHDCPRHVEHIHNCVLELLRCTIKNNFHQKLGELFEHLVSAYVAFIAQIMSPYVWRMHIKHLHEVFSENASCLLSYITLQKL